MESRAPMRRRRSFRKPFASEHHRLKSGNELLWRRRQFFFAIRCIGAPQAIIADNPCISAPQAEDRRSSPTGAAGENFLKNLASTPRKRVFRQLPSGGCSVKIGKMRGSVAPQADFFSNRLSLVQSNLYPNWQSPNPVQSTVPRLALRKIFFGFSGVLRL